jgi:hypothetical protein
MNSIVFSYGGGKGGGIHLITHEIVYRYEITARTMELWKPEPVKFDILPY